MGSKVRQPRLFGPNPRRTGRARSGWDVSVAALRQTGRIEAVDEFVVKLGRVAADELDAACSDPDESRYTRGVLMARALDVYRVLRTAENPAANVDSFADLLSELEHAEDTRPTD